MNEKPNTRAYERNVLIDPSGFREYNARWRFPEQANLRGMQALGMALGTLIHRLGVRPEIVAGQTWGTPTMSPYCKDDEKYKIVEHIADFYKKKMKDGQKVLGQSIAEVVTVNGARVVLKDGTWGLVRASSNKPSLVVVVESPVSELSMKAMFRELDVTLSHFTQVGEYDQKIAA